MASAGIDVRACAGEDEQRLGLEIHNTVWPHRAVTMDEVRSFQAGVNDYEEFLAAVDGEDKGSAAIAILRSARTRGSSCSPCWRTVAAGAPGARCTRPFRTGCVSAAAT